jgi:hypothetical protein
MNATHVEKVRRVAARSQETLEAIVLGAGGKKAPDGTLGPPEVLRRVLVDASAACLELWKAEFPLAAEYGKGEKLDLSSADLGGLLITGIGGAALVGASLRGARLDRARLTMIFLHGADLTGASLKGAMLVQLPVEGAVFRDADLSGARGSLYTTKPLDFTGANLEGATLSLEGAASHVLAGARLAGATITVVAGGASGKEAREAKRRELAAFVAALAPEQRAQVKVEEPPEPKGGCFIATAACGSALEPEVEALRALRDRRLARSPAGRRMILAYERFSPPLARWIEPRPLARRAVRSLVVRPAAMLARAVLARGE